MSAVDPGADDIIVYALSTCPWCHKAKEWFAEQALAVEAVNVDELPDDEADVVAAKAFELSGSRGYPVVVIYGEAIVGYHPEQYAEALEWGWKAHHEQ